MPASTTPAPIMPTPPRRIVVTQHNFDPAAEDLLRASGCEVIVPDETRQGGDGRLPREQLAALLEGASGWIIGQAYVTRELLQARPELVALSRRGVGYERVDVSAAAELKRVVTIAAGGNEDSVADHTIGLMLGLLRRVRESQLAMCAGNWTIRVGNDLNGKTVGIVGFGRIGRKVMKRLSGFEVKVLVSAGAHHADAIRAVGGIPVDVATLLSESDVVTLHAPLTTETRFLIDRAAIERMKPSAILINTGRGGLVQDADLLDALRDGRLSGAGLDVFVSEADPSFRPVSDALVALPNVLATPHAAASTQEGIARSNMIAAQNVITVLDGGVPPATCLIVDGRDR